LFIGGLDKTDVIDNAKTALSTFCPQLFHTSTTKALFILLKDFYYFLKTKKQKAFCLEVF